MALSLKSFLFSTLPILISSGALAASTDTVASFDAVVGTYKLIEAKSGACPDTLWIKQNLIRGPGSAADKLEVSISFNLPGAQLLYQLNDFNTGRKTSFSRVPFAPWANASTTTQAAFDGTRLTGSANSTSTYLLTFGALHWRQEMVADLSGNQLNYSYEWINRVVPQNYEGQCVFQKDANE